METIVHKRWGGGHVLRKRYFGLELFVYFDSGIKLWVRSREVSKGISQNEEVAVPTGPDSSPQRMKMIIEALRLGIVPYRDVEQLTCGRLIETKQLSDWLRDGRGTMSLLGPYGSGKTHMAKYAAAIAMNQGYAVAECQLDPTENPPHKPKLVYESLTSSFKFPHGHNVGNFSDFMWKLVNEKPATTRSHEYIATAVRNLHMSKGTPEVDQILDWISGRNYLPLDYLRLYDSGTAANIYCNILSGLSVAATEVGLKGLLVIIDEVETLARGWMTESQVSRGLNLLRGLIMLSNNEESLYSEEATHSSGGTAWEGEHSHLLFSGLKRDVKYAYKIPSHLKVLLASTDVANLYPEDCKIVKLEPFAWKDMEEVALSIVGAYQKAYGFDIGDVRNRQLTRTLAKVGAQGNIRRFIKGVVECMDYARHSNSRDFEQLEIFD